ncbi:MAG TPA: superoxide dismutase family protein [Kofleriaceae bacterium]|nr:superoxide dismutase family protein [Kofleriaceae bacterium]
MAACGGGKKKTTTPEPMPEARTEPAGGSPEATPTPPAGGGTEAKAEPAPPPPPPPKMWHAKAELAPVKGAKLKSKVAVMLHQEEGKGTAVQADTALEGLKPGKYVLVVHEAADCGPNATKAGKVWADTAANAITIEVTKDAPGKVDSSDVAINLDGDKAVVGKTLVLHEDNKGKPGKAVACGSIAKAEDAGGAAPAGGGGATK